MIQKAKLQELAPVASLAGKLWPGHTQPELRMELAELMAQPDAAFFLCYVGEKAVGFAQCQLRHDYVEGTESSPVGYLEGIYVLPEHRRRGLARQLLSACEAWAREAGCGEFASDCQLNNEESLRFHLHMGFGEANRIICFTKKL